MLLSATPDEAPAGAAPLRLGFLGTGWIGRHRMAGLAVQPGTQVVAIADPSPVERAAAAALAPKATLADDLDALLEQELDGIVIATPSALHAAQSIRALERGVAVFCQKPLGRNAAEVRSVVDAARAADRLLAVDLSYRFTAAMQAIRPLVQRGELGAIRSADLVFHNAYGPDKAWFYDPAQSGGGCVMDLGIHLVDLALWTLDFPQVAEVTSWLGGSETGRCEDHAFAMLRLESGAAVRIACSWRLHAGQDALISASFFGTEGGAAMRNIDGSFYDFTAERYRGTSTETLSRPPDDWGARAALGWARRLSRDRRFDPEVERLVNVARVLDRIYAGC